MFSVQNESEEIMQTDYAIEEANHCLAKKDENIYQKKSRLIPPRKKARLLYVLWEMLII
jgi:hypothetical protein